MLDVVSSEPVSRGAKKRRKQTNKTKRDPVVLSKNTVHLVHAEKSALQAPERSREGRPLLLFGGSLRELLSTRNPSVPGFHPIRSHWGQRWEPRTRSTEALFSE